MIIIMIMIIIIIIIIIIITLFLCQSTLACLLIGDTVTKQTKILHYMLNKY